MTRNAVDLRIPAHWSVDGFVGHSVRFRGPIMVESYCGRSLHGTIVEDKPARICGDCIKAQRRAEQARKAKEQQQGSLF